MNKKKGLVAVTTLTHWKSRYNKSTIDNFACIHP